MVLEADGIGVYMETKDRTLNRLKFMDYVHGRLVELRDVFNKEQGRSDLDGDIDVASQDAGLKVRLWSNRGQGSSSVCGSVSLYGIFDVSTETEDNGYGTEMEDQVVPSLFWKVYEACMKAPDMEW